MIESTSSPVVKHSPLGTLAWAIYLGVSWTWVIGMFLPVLLVRNFGFWGWVAFAVPNVVGAAAMGWVLRDGAASERFVRRHVRACQAFSIVTIAYHVFFALWMIERLRGWGLVAIGVYAIISIAFALPARSTRARNVLAWALAIIALAGSLAVAGMLHARGTLQLPSIHSLGTASGPSSVAATVPVFVLGFALCPYLDLTFHRARQSTSIPGGRFAFGFGFGVVFFSMIIFTLLYAQLLAPAVGGMPLTELSATLLAVHLIVQSTFTVSAHVRELSANENAGTALSRRGWLMAGSVFAIAAIGGWLATVHRPFLGHDSGECIYWCLLGFYGLATPAYLCFAGFRVSSDRIPARTLPVVVACTIAGVPLYWMGFVEGRTGWLLPGVLVVLATMAFRHKALGPAGRVVTSE